MLTLTATTTEIELTYPTGTTADDYQALVAQITPEGADGTYTDISTRATDAAGWSVEADLEDSRVTVTAGSGKALLHVTLISADGNELSASCIVNKPDYVISEEEDGSTTYTVYNTEGFLAWADAVRALKATQPGEKAPDINCVLTADVDLQGESWEVLAPNTNYPYRGTLDGAGHTISNLTVNVTTGKASLIGNGTGCTIKNLTLVNPNITNTVGGVGAFLQTMDMQAVIENCHVVGGKVSATGNNGTNVGGLVGEVYHGSTIRGCSSSAEVSGLNNVGGLVGIIYNSNEDVQIVACYATGTLTAKRTNVAGIAGNVRSGSADNMFTSCYYKVKDVQSGYYFDGSAASNENVINVDDISVTWSQAAIQMNAALTDTGYQWVENTGTDKESRPLIISTPSQE